MSQMEPVQGPWHLAALQRKVGLAVIALEVILAVTTQPEPE